MVCVEAASIERIGVWHFIRLPGSITKRLIEIMYTNNVQTYFLNLATLLVILSRQKRSGTLQADHVHMPNIRSVVSISIVIEHGVVRDCRFFPKQKNILDGEPAYRAALTLQAVEWHWHPLPISLRPLLPSQHDSSSLSMLSHRKERVDFPQQTARAQDRNLLQQLSRQHRRVLSLCDGNRSLQKIATVLTIAPQALSTYIHDLEKWGLIQLRLLQEAE